MSAGAIRSREGFDADNPCAPRNQSPEAPPQCLNHRGTEPIPFGAETARQRLGTAVKIGGLRGGLGNRRPARSRNRSTRNSQRPPYPRPANRAWLLRPGTNLTFAPFSRFSLSLRSPCIRLHFLDRAFLPSSECGAREWRPVVVRGIGFRRLFHVF